MAGFKDFREIVAWQLAHELKLIADGLLARPDAARRFKFCDQLSDAARSRCSRVQSSDSPQERRMPLTRSSYS